MLLEGIKVIDAASYVAGPAAATVMADYGADVIKVEPPRGDTYRTLAARHRTNYNWQLTSRNKRSLSLDLGSEQGQTIMKRLLTKADVLLVNFREDQLKKYGLEYNEIKSMNPGLIYAHISGYGQAGKDNQRRAYDTTAWWARSGILELMRHYQSVPAQPVGGVGDHASAMSLFGGIMMALYNREKTGEGAFVSTSLLANGAWSNGMHLQGAIAGYDLSEILEKTEHRSPFARIYETSDDRCIILVVPEPHKEWASICRALRHKEWMDDERFSDVASIMKNRILVGELFAAAIRELTLDEVESRFRSESVTFSVVEKITDVVKDQQLIDNGILVPTNSENEDYQWTVSSPLSIRGYEKKPPADAPEVGQHSREVLRDAGYSDKDIDLFMDDKVIRE